jgi:putative oxidoreductase
MTDTFTTAPAPVDNTAGVRAMSRLADRLAAVAPPPAPANLAAPSALRFSPAVTAALSRSSAMSAGAARRARRPRSTLGIVVDSFVSACSFIPYALVALVLRLVMARLFFIDGQSLIAGPAVRFENFDFFMVLPAHVKAETFSAFLTQYPALPMSTALAAYIVSYADFILPIFLVLGFGTRFAAFGLLIITAMIQFYTVPLTLWSMHVYWASILLVLLSLGAGQISVDYIIRFAARR